MKKDLTSINDLSKDEILGLLKKSIELKQAVKTQPRLDLAPGTMGALIFEKPSTRTRVSFEAAAWGLQGKAVADLRSGGSYRWQAHRDSFRPGYAGHAPHCRSIEGR